MSVPSIFEPSDPPARQRRFAISKRATWLTWSGEFRRFLGEWSRYAQRSPPPGKKLVGSLRPYGETFWHRVDERSGLGAALRGFTNALMRGVDLGALLFFDRMLDAGTTRTSIHLLFAAMRDEIAAALGDRRAALYNPLGSFGKNEGGFPLHADLYAPRFLFNIFDEVPNDGSGAAIFLSVDELPGLLSTVASLPRQVRMRILACQRRVVTDDRYDEFYGLLHDALHPWWGDLRARFRKAQLTMPFERGQGYLLDDRRWLHGRLKPTGGVTQNRIHRLIFDSRRTAAARRRELNAI